MDLPRLLAAVDVDYRDEAAVAACVLFQRWDDAVACHELTLQVTPIAPYQPGALYLRELPPILAVLARAREVSAHPLACVIVDAYVWLGPERPGLGAHLHQALGGAVPVIGVAKTPFRGAEAIPVLRGHSARPLLVTAAGLDAAEAAAHLRAMHGLHRIPTLLGRVDRLSRGTAPDS